MALSPDLLEILACPQCKGELEYREGEAALSDEGPALVEFDAIENKDENDSQYFVEVRVTDQSRREIRGAATIFATRQPFFVRTESRRSLFKARSTRTRRSSRLRNVTGLSGCSNRPRSPSLCGAVKSCSASLASSSASSCCIRL